MFKKLLISMRGAAKQFLALKDKTVMKASLFLWMLLLSQPSHAVQFSTIFQNVNRSIQSFGEMVGAWGYAAAALFFVLAGFAIKQHNDDPRQHTLKTPAFLALAAMFLAYIPTTADSVGDSTFGEARRTQGKAGNTGPF